MRRCFAILLSILLLITMTPVVSADVIYNDDSLNWDGMYDPTAPCTHRTRTRYEAVASTCVTHGHGAYAICNDCGVVLEGSNAELPLLNHTYDNACDDTCNVCGAVRSVQPHAYVGQTLMAATCGRDGQMRYTCSVCGDSYDEVLPAGGEHTYDNACDADCNVCDSQRPVGEHVYDNGGDTDCNVCGALRDACNHVYDNACDVSCNVAGCGYIRETPPHSYAVETVNPTCVQDGYHTYTCIYCGDCYRETILAAGHNVTTDAAVTPTCTADGLTAGSHCSVCGTVFAEQQVVPATGHTEIAMPGFDATCTEPGLTDGSFCLACGEALVLQEAIAPLGHAFDDDYDATCNHCDYVRDVTIKGDANGDGVVNNRDLGLLQQCINEWVVTIDVAVVDMNGDGRLSNRDLGLFQRFLNEL